MKKITILQGFIWVGFPDWVWWKELKEQCIERKNKVNPSALVFQRKMKSLPQETRNIKQTTNIADLQCFFKGVIWFVLCANRGWGGWKSIWSTSRATSDFQEKWQDGGVSQISSIQYQIFSKNGHKLWLFKKTAQLLSRVNLGDRVGKKNRCLWYWFWYKQDCECWRKYDRQGLLNITVVAWIFWFQLLARGF